MFENRLWRVCPIAFSSTVGCLVIPKEIIQGFASLKKVVWKRVKLPSSDGIFCQGTFPGNSLTKTKYRQWARLFSRDCGLYQYKTDKWQWLTQKSSHRWHAYNTCIQGTGRVYSSHCGVLLYFKRNNLLLLNGSRRTHSWKVNPYLEKRWCLRRINCYCKPSCKLSLQSQ